MNSKRKFFPVFVFLTALFTPFGFAAEEQVYLRAELHRETGETDTREETPQEEEKYIRADQLPQEVEREPFIRSELAQELIEDILEEYRDSDRTFFTSDQIAEIAYYQYTTAKRRLEDPAELVPYAIFYYLSVSTYPGKQRILEEALTYGQEAWGDKDSELISIHRLIGKNQYFLGDWEAAKKSFKQAEKLIKKNKLGDERSARHFADVGFFLRRNNQSLAGFDYALKARKAAKKLKGEEHVELKARIEYELGYLQLMQHKLNKAEKYSLNALEMLNDIESQSLTHYSTGILLANISHRQGDIDAAMEYIFSFARHPAAEARDEIALDAYPLKTATPSYVSMSDSFEVFTITARFTVGVDGLVSDKEILNENVDPEIVEAVMSALDKFRFAPRIVNAERVETKYRHNFVFSNLDSLYSDPYY